MEKLKVDQIKSILNCGYCKRVYNEPIWLPCHETICLSDLEKIKNDDGTINCPFCNVTHLEPNDGFQVDKKVLKLLELEVNHIDFGEAFNKGKNLLNILNEELTRFENLKNNPNTFIENHFVDLRAQIFNRKEELDMINNECTNSLIQETKQFEEECKLLANKRKAEHSDEENSLPTPETEDTLQKELFDMRLKLNQWFKQFDQVVLDEKKRDQVLVELSEVIPELGKKSTLYQQKLLQSKLVHLDVEKNSKEKIKSLFGHLKFDEIKTENKEAVSSKNKIQKTNHLKKSIKNKLPTVCKSLVRKSSSHSLKLNENRKQPIRTSRENGLNDKQKTNLNYLKDLNENDIRTSIKELLKQNELNDLNSYSPQVCKAICEQIETKHSEFHFGRDKITMINRILKEIEESNKKSHATKRVRLEEDEACIIQSEENDNIETVCLKDCYIALKFV